VRPAGFEPATPWFEAKYSNPLSYGRVDSVYYSNRDERGKIVRRFSNFEAASRYLDRFYRNARTEYKLDNMWQLMEFLDHPQEKFKTVHVAGTSGKTSTAHYMAALLAASGKKTGLTVSPHVDQINERLQINMEPLAEREFCDALAEFLGLIEKTDIQPSWFEVMIAFVYWYFAREGVEYAVVEVGLGGLKDGTNVIRRQDKVCIITDIGLDHVGILGDTVEAIAEQKVGIVQRRNAVFTYPQTPEILDVFKQAIAQQAAILHVIREDTTGEEAQLPAYQYRNWYLAHRVYLYLSARDTLPHLTRQVLYETMHVKIPGRMDIIKTHDRTVVMDGAHNYQKMTAFIDSFHKLFPHARPLVLVSLREGKDYQEVAPLLAQLTDQVIVTTFKTAQDLPIKSMDPALLADALRHAGVAEVQVLDDQHKAVKMALKSAAGIIVITGSFYMLSQIRNNEYLL
jgi:dihydrofolate synthase/folylpolyglutamate synthase